MMYTSRKMCGDSVEMREMAARICRDYLHGAWKNVTAQNIGFKHISGGLSNWLYHVWLPSASNKQRVPQQVLIRVYGQMHGERALEALITESVVFTLLSERGLGPRLHGVFPGGRIEEYIAARPLKTRELSEARMSACIARKMAQRRPVQLALPRMAALRVQQAARSSASPDPGVRADARRACAGGAHHGVRGVHAAERARAGPQAARGVPGRPHRGVHRRQAAQDQGAQRGEDDGGLSNWLYHVWLPSASNKQRVPQQVLIRVYGQMHGERALEALITESVVFTLLSERGLGPRLHGVFPGGRIEEYIAARPLKTRELSEPRMSACIARKMAQVHTMEVPLSKEPRWLWDTMQRWQITCQKKLIDAEIPKTAEFLKQLDFTSELSYLKKIIALQPSPVVFCHNDFQEGNILLQEDTPNNIDNDNNNKDPKLVLIDFEYCSYNYRGFDIANHLLEWTYDYTEPSAPYYKENRDAYATETQQLNFIKNYLTETGSNQSPQTIISEIRTYSLASHLFWGLWSIVNAGSSQITFGYWEYATSRLGAYLRMKEELSLVPTTQTQKRKIEETM